jgi:hypothetical protein
VSRLLPDAAESSRPQTPSFWTCLWSTLFIAALFFAVSLLGSPVPGVNEPHYLAKARTFQDPTWCSRDFFLISSNAHYCFFWIVGSLTQWMSLATIALLGRALSSLVLAVGWNMLGGSLSLPGDSRFRAACLAACLFAALSLQGSFSGEWLLGGFESKVPAWGFALMSLSFWTRSEISTCNQKSIDGQPSRFREMGMAGAACGIACALHPVVGGWVAICICLASVALWWRHQAAFGIAVTRLFVFAAATVLVSLPGLIPALRLVLDQGLPQNDRELATFYQVFWRLKHHLDPTELLASQWLYAAILVAIILMAALLHRRSTAASREPAQATDAALKTESDGLACLLMFFAMSAVVALAGVAVGWHSESAQKMVGWEWRAALLKFYPFRCFDAMLPITAAWMLASLAKKKLAHVRALRGLAGTAAITLFAVLVPLQMAWQQREAAPAGYTVQQFSDWKSACEWIRINTPSDALILTPRESYAFKWFAERAEFVCYKDCPQDAAGILMWNRRLWLLHDWTLKSSSDGLYDAADLEVLQQKTDVDFVLTRILGPFQAEPIWQSGEWRIYAVP